MKISVLNLVFDDYVEDEYGEWSRICEDHLNIIQVNNPRDVERHVRLREGTGLCGVVGCISLAEHYVDF